MFKKRVRAGYAIPSYFLIIILWKIRNNAAILVWLRAFTFFSTQEHELDRYITFCDGKSESDSFLESHPKDFFKVATLKSYATGMFSPFLLSKACWACLIDVF